MPAVQHLLLLLLCGASRRTHSRGGWGGDEVVCTVAVKALYLPASCLPFSLLQLQAEYQIDNCNCTCEVLRRCQSTCALQRSQLDGTLCRDANDVLELYHTLPIALYDTSVSQPVCILPRATGFGAKAHMKLRVPEGPGNQVRGVCERFYDLDAVWAARRGELCAPNTAHLTLSLYRR